MRTPQWKTKHVLLLSLLLLIAVPAIGIMAARKAGQRRGQETRKALETLPEVISKVKDLEVLSATIKRQGQPNAVAAIEIRNNSELAVNAVDVTSGEYGMTTNGLADPDKRIVIIEPHGTIVVELNLSNLDPSAPILVAGAVYADGTEAGEPSSLKAMRSVRERDKAQRQTQPKGGIPR